MERRRRRTFERGKRKRQGGGAETAQPKSATLAMPSVVTRMLRVLRSRWMMHRRSSARRLCRRATHVSRGYRCLIELNDPGSDGMD
eukprot:2343827-Rhodomonas_salina.2